MIFPKWVTWDWIFTSTLEYYHTPVVSISWIFYNQTKIIIVGEDNKTNIHHKVAATDYCVIMLEDWAMLPIHNQQHQNQSKSISGSCILCLSYPDPCGCALITFLTIININTLALDPNCLSHAKALKDSTI